MSEKQNKRDIRAFFAAYSRSRKRPSLGDVGQGQARSKSPRLEPKSPSGDIQGTPSRKRRTFVDLASLDDTDPEDDDTHPAQRDALPSERQRQTSSFATLTSGSQATSSQRVVKNGELMVTNSDEEGDSDSDVDGLDQLLGLRKAEGNDSKHSGPGLRFSTWAKPSVMAGTRLPSDMRNHFRVDTSFKSKQLLADLAAQTAKERAAAAAVQKKLASINANESRVQMLQDQSLSADVPDDIDPSTVAAMIGDMPESDGVDRLIQAVKRTDALRSKLEWSFFASQTPDLNVPLRPPSSLLKFFGNRAHTEASFVDGFIDDLIAGGEIETDEDNLEWTLSVALTSSRDHLHSTYCNLLIYSKSDEFLNPDWVWRIFSLMGASCDALEPQIQIVPRLQIKDLLGEEPRNWMRVLRILNIVQRCAGRLPAATRHQVLIVLCRLALDVEVSVHHQVRVALCRTFDSLLNAISENEFESSLAPLVSALPAQIQDARLRARLLHTFDGTSPRSLRFRHLLACEFFFEQPSEIAQLYGSKWIQQLHDRLAEDEEFQLHPGMDFALLAALIDMLDILVDDGCIDPGHEEDAKALNRSVDQLADRVKSMATQIRDSGANHLARTEAKESLDALYARLLFAVRSEPRPKKSIFGSGTGAGAMGSERFMEKFLQQSRDRKGESANEEE